ncbi:hypothetical protein ACWDUD_27960 [Rhodococcus sp. NPDC003382]
MNRKSVAALITATLAVGLAGCSSHDSRTVPSIDAAISTTSTSPFDSDDFTGDKQRFYAKQIIDAAERHGATVNQVLAALVAAKAESGWIAGGGNKYDIFGWEHRLQYGASDSNTAAPLATDNFIDVAATITIDESDPVSYALAVQHADPRGYDEEEHFPKKGETAAAEYATALPYAQAAYEELRDGR